MPVSIEVKNGRLLCRLGDEYSERFGIDNFNVPLTGIRLSMRRKEFVLLSIADFLEMALGTQRENPETVFIDTINNAPAAQEIEPLYDQLSAAIAP